MRSTRFVLPALVFGLALTAGAQGTATKVGIINIQTSERNGKVIGIAQVSDDAELMLITQQGKILRMAAKDIRTIGRATQGVRLIDIEGDDRAVSIARLAEKDEEE